MKHIHILIFTLAMTLTSVTSSAQSMRTFDVGSGLSSNSIKGIIQDRKGYIWFATTDGLNSYNGRVFKSYGCSFQSSGNGDPEVINLMTIQLHKDGRKIWAGAQSHTLYLFNPDTESFKEIQLSNDLPYSPNLCYSLAYANDGSLWIGTDAGLYIYNEDEDRLTLYSSQNSNLPSDSIHYIYCDSNGTMWLGSTKGLLKFNQVTKDFSPVKVAKDTFGNLADIHITYIVEDGSENLWIGTWNKGLAILDKNSNILRAIRPSGDNEFAARMRIRSILPDTGGIFWICTNHGLFKYNTLRNTLSSVIISTEHPNDNIYSSLKDREGGIWIGTLFQGVHYLSPRARQIECYTTRNSGKFMKGSAISSFYEDENGMIYITSENGGLSLYDPQTGKLKPCGAHIDENNLHAICIKGTDLYAGTYSHGLKVIGLRTGHSRNYTKQKHPELRSNNIFSLYKDSRGDILIGTDMGCTRFDSRSESFKSTAELEGEFIYDILEDKFGNTWYATYYNGLYRYSKDTGQWHHYTHDPNNPSSLPHNKTLQFSIDEADNLWICTEGGGAARFDYQHGDFRRLTLTFNGQELKLAIVDALLSDSEGRLWLSSNNGIWVCDTEGRVTRHLTHEDGLQSNQYNSGSAYRSSTGKLFFGGINGFNVIIPERLRDNNISPTVTARIRSYDKNNNTIPRNVHSFTVDFECLSFIAPHKNEFAYCIDENNEWISTAEASVTFLNFPYGKHTIRVKARNGDGIWSTEESRLTINNLPPVYKSSGAKMCYIAIALAIFIFLIFFIERQREEKSRIRFNEIKRAQEKEADRAKIEFFTHVAHEIKTPVTLIKAPLEVLLHNFPAGDQRNNLEIMSKNTNRLLNLVNQLLDFKKISSEAHNISMKASDPSEILLNVATRFDGSLLGELRITTHLPQDRLNCLIDPEAYTKIISNLLTNAVKYAVSHIDASLGIIETQGERILHLEVTDDGCGIPAEERKRIFDSFYQINTTANPRMNGVGLGLSLVKLLVQKHQGNVYVDENYENGCRICVDIPYIATDEPIEKESAGNDLEMIEPAAEVKGLNILIAEDTSDMLEFVASIMKDKHTIHKAPNGKIALETLYHSDIDLIISDISMPVMNGFELLQEIRRNEMFCHIPVIMLTVENTLESRIKGLEYGADAYIEKPFSATHLMATVGNLITRRNSMIKRYTDHPLQENESIVASHDHNWFAHLTRFIHDNIHESEISIEQIASELCMSRSSFQRKLKGLTGLSPVEFIRLIRLKKAAEILNTGRHRINEVAYMVGFSKPSYFSAMFKKQFGVLPKDFIHKEDKEADIS